tara:strand:- start:477 stop:671 length:195 start_codon:yes stop_codon:yes gene_type:complete
VRTGDTGLEILILAKQICTWKIMAKSPSIGNYISKYKVVLIKKADSKQSAFVSKIGSIRIYIQD